MNTGHCSMGEGETSLIIKDEVWYNNRISFNWFAFKFCHSCESSKHNKLFMWSISTCDKGSREVNLSSAQTLYLRTRSYPHWSVNFSGWPCENALLAWWEWLGGKRQDWMRCKWMYFLKQGRLGKDWLGPIEVNLVPKVENGV